MRAASVWWWAQHLPAAGGPDLLRYPGAGVVPYALRHNPCRVAGVRDKALQDASRGAKAARTRTRNRTCCIMYCCCCM